MTLKKVQKSNSLNGEIIIPADKSISHRAVMLSSLAKGKSVIKNFSNGEDCRSTLSVFKQLGIEIAEKDELVSASTDKSGVSEISEDEEVSEIPDTDDESEEDDDDNFY